MSDDPIRQEMLALRNGMDMNSRFKLEILAALSKTFREFEVAVSDDLFKHLTLAVPDEIAGLSIHTRGPAPVAPQPPSSVEGQPPSSTLGQPPSSNQGVLGQPPSSDQGLIGQPPSSDIGQPPSSSRGGIGQPPSSDIGQPPSSSKG